MANDHADHHDEAYHGHHHITSTKMYLGILGALLVLTGLTVAAYNVRLGDWNLFVAVLIASVKATLVCTFFMHLKYDNPFNVVILVGTLVFVGIFFGYIINDTSHRGRAGTVQGLRRDPDTGQRPYGMGSTQLAEADFYPLEWPEGHSPEGEATATGPGTSDGAVLLEAARAISGETTPAQDDSETATARGYDLRLRTIVGEGGTKMLKAFGDVPDEATREQISMLGGEFFDSVDVSELQVSDAASYPAELGACLQKGVQGLSLLSRGQIDFQASKVEITGEADADHLGQFRALFSSLPEGFELEPFHLLDSAEADACDSALREILQTQIQFDTGSDHINDASSAVLDQINEAANGCPDSVHLTIDGHTDNTGNAAGNQRLSQQRAQAVLNALVERGIDENRLEAHGFGQERPVGDNATEEGRAQNRRIEIHLVRL